MNPPAVRRDVIAGAVTAIGGLILFTTAQSIERLPGDTETIGPGTFPTALSAILVAAGLALCASGLRGKGDNGSDLGDQTPMPWRRLLSMVVLFAGYCVAFIPIGFLISTAAFLMAVASVLDPARWKRNLLFAAGFSAVVYTTFTMVLEVELPTGVLAWMH